MEIGKYEYSKAAAGFGASFMLVGIAYAVYTRKSVIGILVFALAGSFMGFGLSMITFPPKRIKE